MSGKLKKIDRQFQKLELKKQKLMQSLISISEEMYNQPPAADKWSIRQVCNHVYLSEQLSLAYLQKKLSYPDTVPGYHPGSWINLYMIKFAFWTRYKFKAPKAIDMRQGQPVLSYHELSEKWSVSRAALYQFVTENEETFGTHLAYKHPFAGRLTMYQMLIFLEDHMTHHMKQIEKIIRQ